MSKSAWLSRRFVFKPVACAGLAAALGVSAGQAQFRPDYWEMVAESERARAEQARVLEREQLEARLAERSARAHARTLQEGGFSAGLTGAVDWQAAHPNVFDSGSGGYNNYTYVVPPQQRYTFWSSPGLDFPIWQDVAPEGEPIESLYSDYISEPIVQTHCINCHREGAFPAAAPNSRLQFSPKTVEDYVELNRAVFENLVTLLEEDEEVGDPVAHILNKVSGGIAHQGGTPVPTGTADYANLERFLRQVAEESGSTTAGLTPETLFEGVTMASPARTLRRAAILFAGRLPTQAELDAVADGEESSLRQTIRGLMSSEKFHEFLITASNDRLLTDRQIDDGVIDFNDSYFVALNQKLAERLRASIVRGYFENYNNDALFWTWEEAVMDGHARAPLELIAHVVENDLPYTEILTADYIMANPMTAEAYGASTNQFDDVNNPFEFKPSEIVSYYRNDDSKVVDEDEELDFEVVIDPGNLITDYPHAGILNTTAFLTRYPSTATNRNRARSRWTYYHFLGHDIEKSNPRPTDPEALLDENNPTFNNPACIACHQALDPVAGAYQNYGDEGLYRDQWGGMDSLPDLYKDPEDGSVSRYREGDTWYRDMRSPGFGEEIAPSVDNGLQWLAGRIVADERFAEAAVKFWWQPIMGVDILAAPTDSGDPDYLGRSVAAKAQASEVSRIATAFRRGIEGGSAYNGKDLLTEIALSPWFRAESVTGVDAVQMVALANAGVSRLLTPEELDRKTDAVAGYVWGRRFHQTTDPERGKAGTLLVDGNRWEEGPFELLYGGIDSDGVITRAVDMTPVMAAVAQSHAAQVSCPIVRREFFFWDDDDRLLFDGISAFDTPVSEGRRFFEVDVDSYEARQPYSLDVPLLAGWKTVRITFDKESFGGDENDRELNLDRLSIRDSAGNSTFELEFEHIGSGGQCGRPADLFNSFYRMHGHGPTCSIEIPVRVSHDDVYEIEIVAHQTRVGEYSVRMIVTVDSDDGTSAGADAIRLKLVDLHEKLFGANVAPDSQDVEEAFNVFFEVWSRKRRTEGTHFEDSEFQCDDDDITYYDGMIEDPLRYNEYGFSDLDSDKVDKFYEGINLGDPVHAVRAWVATLTYLMTDYRYLYY